MERISPMSDWHPLNRNNRLCAKVVRPKPVIAPEKFGRLLREWRKRHGFNQMDACMALISNWENAKAMPRKPRLLRMLAIITEAAR